MKMEKKKSCKNPCFWCKSPDALALSRRGLLWGKAMVDTQVLSFQMAALFLFPLPTGKKLLPCSSLSIRKN